MSQSLEDIRYRTLREQGDHEGAARFAANQSKDVQQFSGSYEKWKQLSMEAAADAGDPYYRAAVKGEWDGTCPVDVKGVMSESYALHGACYRGDIALVRRLLAAGAAVDQADSTGHTPLRVAVEWQHPDVVRLLLEHHADVRAIEAKGNTALHCAAVNDSVEVVQMLLDSGAPVDVANGIGSLPVHVAAGHGRTELLRLLVERSGVDARRSQDQATPLMFAARGDDVPDLQLLVDMGADPSLQDAGGHTALDVARSQGKLNAIAFLERLGKPQAATLPALHVTGSWPKGKALQWTLISQTLSDTTSSPLWKLYLKAVEFSPAEVYALPGAARRGEKDGIYRERPMDTVAHCESAIVLYATLNEPTALDDLLMSAMAFARAQIVVDLVTQHSQYTLDNAWSSLQGVMDEAHTQAPRPLDMMMRWCTAVGAFATAHDRHDDIVEVLGLVAGIASGLESRARQDWEECFATMVHRVCDKRIETQGLHAAREWAESARQKLEPGSGLLEPLRSVLWKLHTDLMELPDALRIASETLGWAQEHDTHHLPEVWKDRHRTTEAALSDPYQRGRCGSVDGLEDVNATGTSGRTALMGAAKAGDTATMETLLRRGARLDSQDPQGWTAVMVAAHAGQVEAIRSLCRHKANLNLQTHRGETALHVAAWAEETASAQALLDAGADRTLADQKGATVQSVARTTGNKSLLKLLSS